MVVKINLKLIGLFYKEIKLWCLSLLSSPKATCHTMCASIRELKGIIKPDRDW